MERKDGTVARKKNRKPRIPSLMGRKKEGDSLTVPQGNSPGVTNEEVVKQGQLRGSALPPGRLGARGCWEGTVGWDLCNCGGFTCQQDPALQLCCRICLYRHLFWEQPTAWHFHVGGCTGCGSRALSKVWGSHHSRKAKAHKAVGGKGPLGAMGLTHRSKGVGWEREGPGCPIPPAGAQGPAPSPGSQRGNSTSAASPRIWA